MESRREHRYISKTSRIPTVSKNLLLSVGKDIDIVVKDGDPIIDVMIELDNSRKLDNLKNFSSCSCDEGPSEPGMEFDSSLVNVSIPVSDSKELG